MTFLHVTARSDVPLLESAVVSRGLLDSCTVLSRRKRPQLRSKVNSIALIGELQTFLAVRCDFNRPVGLRSRATAVPATPEIFR